MNATSNRFAEIGERLRAYRMGRGLAAEQVAERLGVSRAAVYRIEAGEVVKIETLDRLANVLETSVGSLLGLGVEYYANAISYFERMRQIEEKSEQVIAHFPPLSYLLTSDNYSRQLKQTLMEAAPSYAEDGKDYETEIDTIVAVLAARAEIEHLIKLIEQEPMGIQIGLIEEPLPNITFQLFRTSERTLLGLSPFRLGGELPNIRTGVAMLTADEEPVRLYEKLVERLWRRAHKGREAAQQLRMILERSAMKSADTRKAS